MRNILWIDCFAAGVAGVTVLILSGWLSDLHALPEGLLLFIGAVNLLYACYSFSLASRANRPGSLITLLVLANGFWAIVCVGLAMQFAASASAFGMAHLLAEAVFVSGLAGLEWKWRDRLLSA